MIRSVLSLDPKDGDYDAVVAFFRRHRILERAARIDGFVSGEVQVPKTESGPVLVTALWRDEEAYERWLASPERAETGEEFASLLQRGSGAPGRGEVYDVVLTHPERR